MLQPFNCECIDFNLLSTNLKHLNVFIPMHETNVISFGLKATSVIASPPGTFIESITFGFSLK